MRHLGFLTNALMMSCLANVQGNSQVERHTRPDTSNIGGGYSHDGMYSQPKKLRKGAGHRKLTRAQRRKGQK